MTGDISTKREQGFSLIELLVATAVLLPLVGLLVLLFGRGVEYYDAEQRVAQMNQEARNAVEIMSLEVAQAGTRRDIPTTATQAIAASAVSQSVPVVSATGFTAGDWVFVDGGALEEKVQLTAVGANSISGIFRNTHANGASVTYLSLPYKTGIVPPAGLAANSSATTTLLRFYGDLYDDGNLYYVEYAYDSVNLQITKSVTPLTDASKSAAQVLIRSVNAVAGPFTLYSDSEGDVTSVRVDLTVQTTWQKKPQQSRISARLAAPGVAASSSISADDKKYGTPYALLATPAKVVTWSSP